MSRVGPADMVVILRFPRVSGDEPTLRGQPMTAPRFSPRERG